MNQRQGRVSESIDRAVSFVEDPDHQRPRIRPLRDDLVRSRDRIRRLVVAQRPKTRSHDSRQLKSLRGDLRRKHLLPIARRGALLLEGLDGIKESLRVPNARASDKDLLEAAERIAKAVEPYSKTFVRAEFRKDFVIQLRRAAAELDRFIKRPDTVMNQATRATLDLRHELKHARAIVATLDSIVTIEFQDEKTLAEWHGCKRIHDRKGRPRAPRKPKSRLQPA